MHVLQGDDGKANKVLLELKTWIVKIPTLQQVFIFNQTTYFQSNYINPDATLRVGGGEEGASINAHEGLDICIYAVQN